MRHSRTLQDLTLAWLDSVTKVADSGCIEWQLARHWFGHGYVKVGGKMKKAHRVAWEFYNGPIPDGLLVCHRCDNGACVNVDHLFLGTYADNAHDRDAKGRTAHQFGQRHGMCKITDDQVMEIRRARASGDRVKDICARFGISTGHCGDLISGRRRSVSTSGEQMEAA